MRILIVRLSALGDIVHTLPLADNAHAAGCEVGWLTQAAYAPLLTGNPAVSRVFLADTGNWRRNPLSPAVRRDFAALSRELSGFAPEKTIDAQGLWKSAVLARLAGAPVVGFGARSRREPVSALLLSQRVRLSRSDVHVVDQNLSLLSPLGIPIARRAPDARYLLEPASAPAKAALAGLPRPFAVYHPGAARPEKSWGEEKYARLAAILADKLGLFPVISWGPGDERRAERLSALVPEGFVAPPLDLSGLAQLAAASSLFVGGDTGPVHLADAVGAPALAIFGRDASRRNVPSRNRPYAGGAVSYDQAASAETAAALAAELVRSRGA